MTDEPAAFKHRFVFVSADGADRQELVIDPGETAVLYPKQTSIYTLYPSGNRFAMLACGSSLVINSKDPGPDIWGNSPIEIDGRGNQGMTDEPAAIQASFSDFRLIRSRKVCQLVMEIPIEGADAALAALGGIPQPQSDRWVALARLNGVEKPEPEKRKWDELKLSTQASIRCGEKAFWQFLREEYLCDPTSADDAADEVRSICGVNSRSVLNENAEAATTWRNLDGYYQAWLKAVK